MIISQGIPCLATVSWTDFTNSGEAFARCATTFLESSLFSAARKAACNISSISLSCGATFLAFIPSLTKSKFPSIARAIFPHFGHVTPTFSIVTFIELFIEIAEERNGVLQCVHHAGIPVIYSGY